MPASLIISGFLNLSIPLFHAHSWRMQAVPEPYHITGEILLGYLEYPKSDYVNTMDGLQSYIFLVLGIISFGFRWY